MASRVIKYVIDNLSPTNTRQITPNSPVIISEEGRLILESPLLGRGQRTGQWCLDPANFRHGQYLPTAVWEEGWNNFKVHNPTAAVVLTQEESDACVGNLSLEELDRRVRALWGVCVGLVGCNPHVPYPTCTCSYPWCKTCSAKEQGAAVKAAYTEWLSYFISSNQTFGTVHAFVGALHIRQHYSFNRWPPYFGDHILFPSPDHHTDQPELHGVYAPVLTHQRKRNASGLEEIDQAGAVCPRRVWDICANRVIPCTWFIGNQSPIAEFHLFGLIVPASHAWTAPQDLQYVMTNINYNLWPVPIPKGVDLESIRGGLIRKNVRYAWLDVLCLRQAAQPTPEPLPIRFRAEILQAREQCRFQEWETDVPLIGAVYRRTYDVVVYLSGLGKPFQPGNWNDSRHWLRRAWTLQETKVVNHMLVAGLENTRLDPWKCKCFR
ncbi:hypothetical protein BDZ91DRAFT_802657 [Kalaharituber pfeilii]|nr:hypothetical protein BDZ91DRAFT_802657 [Kalaharituber pfeilii]